MDNRDYEAINKENMGFSRRIEEGFVPNKKSNPTTAKVLSAVWDYDGHYQVVRIYMEKDFEQAKKDFEIMCKVANGVVLRLDEVEVF